MGTNYYIRENICDKCNRYKEEHIWKSSWWRDFTIRHHKEHYNSWNEFKNFLKGKKIFDEYGSEITRKELLALIEDKKARHPFKHREIGTYDPEWIYIDWFYFLNCTFC